MLRAPIVAKTSIPNEIVLTNPATTTHFKVAMIKVKSTKCLLVILNLAFFSIPLSATGSDSDANMNRIGDLLVDRTEVTIAEFAEYVSSTGTPTQAEKNGGLVYDSGWTPMPGWYWQQPFGQKADANLPAVHITFDEAQAYCQWADKRLPTDNEWQRVAYTESRTQPEAPFTLGETYPYPTGLEPVGANCLNECGETSAIDYSAKLARGIGPAPVATSKVGVNGLYDMGANVWEWTDIDSDTQKGTRGGSWWYGSGPMQRDHRATKPRDMAVVYIGFRCVRDVD